jgi:hypothetical protein
MRREEHDPLDAWLATAKWNEPAPGAEQRLQATLRNARRSSHAWRILALAASVVIVVGASWPLARWLRESQRPVIDQVHLVPVLQLRAAPEDWPRTSVTSREPTPLEGVMLRSLKKEPTRIATAPVEQEIAAKPPRSLREIQIGLTRSDLADADRLIMLQELLERGSDDAIGLYLKQVADAESREIALALLDNLPRPPIQRLIARLNDPLVEVRMAAARALGRIDGPELTRQLANMAERNQNRREAIMALACSDGAEAREFVRRAAVSGSLVSVTKSVLAELHQEKRI